MLEAALIPSCHLIFDFWIFDFCITLYVGSGSKSGSETGMSRQKVAVSVVRYNTDWSSTELAVLPVEREEADGEAEGVEHLVFHGGEEDVQLLRLRRDGAGTQVRVPSYRPEQYMDLRQLQSWEVKLGHSTTAHVPFLPF